MWHCIKNVRIRVLSDPHFRHIYLWLCPYTRKYESEENPYSAIYIYDSVLIRENTSQRKAHILPYISTILSLYEKIWVRENLYSGIYIYDSVLIRENTSQRKTHILAYFTQCDWLMTSPIYTSPQREMLRKFCYVRVWKSWLIIKNKWIFV